VAGAMSDARVFDVAALAGVSIGTVSNVLNRPDKVSATTAAKVRAAIDQLGFVPNEFARRLRTGKTAVPRSIAAVADVAPTAAQVSRSTCGRALTRPTLEAPPKQPKHQPMKAIKPMLDSIKPGQLWLDTKGNRIQAHGGSILALDDTFYWYGENKEHSTAGSGVWHWGVRCYSSTDLYNWTDRGLIIPPELDDQASPLHPHVSMDRPHILRHPATGKFVCWTKVMTDAGQRSTVLTADSILGPYEIVRSNLRPLGMNAGDFDLVIDPTDGKGYYYFERVHSELICADLTEDYTNVTGYYSTHFPLVQPPYVREAPAYFTRDGLHYLITSGTTGYYPNPSQVAVAPSYHGPWKELNDPHPGDETRSSFQSQVSSVFRHPHKRDLYIALADRWLPRYQAPSDEAIRLHAERFRPMGGHHPGPWSELTEIDTSIADYVWLPLRFDNDHVTLEWTNEWRIEDFE
jgi:hypothetical protein